MIFVDFLESLKLNGYGDVLDAVSCKNIIFRASSMSEKLLASWYRDAVADSLATTLVEDPFESGFDTDDIREVERIVLSNHALVDILAAVCLVRGIVLLPRLDS